MTNTIENLILELPLIKDKQTLINAYEELNSASDQSIEGLKSNDICLKFVIKTFKTLVEPPWNNFLSESEQKRILDIVFKSSGNSLKLFEYVLQFFDVINDMAKDLNYQKRHTFKSQIWDLLSYVVFEKNLLVETVKELLYVDNTLAAQALSQLLRFPGQISNFLEEIPQELRDQSYFTLILNEVEQSFTKQSKMNISINDHATNILYLLNKCIILGKRGTF